MHDMTVSPKSRHVQLHPFKVMLTHLKNWFNVSCILMDVLRSTYTVWG